MARKKLIVANWKMHLDVSQSLDLLRQLNKRIKTTADVEVVLCPSFIALAPLLKEVDPKKFRLGAQDAHFTDQGAFTGEVSATMLRGLAEYVIVGHSERRSYFAENDETVARKVAAVFRNHMTPVLCVGENLAERQDGETNIVIHDQLTAGLIMLTASEVAQLVIAYEPVWAVGTGEIAKPDQVKQAVKVIRNTIKQLYGLPAAKQARVLYGGSVTPDYIHGYLAIPGLDGFLPGGASLHPEDFSQVVEQVRLRKSNVLKKRNS